MSPVKHTARLKADSSTSTIAEFKTSEFSIDTNSLPLVRLEIIYALSETSWSPLFRLLFDRGYFQSLFPLYHIVCLHNHRYVISLHFTVLAIPLFYIGMTFKFAISIYSTLIFPISRLLYFRLRNMPRGGSQDFKWQGWSNGGADIKPPEKSLRLQTKPQKIPGPKFKSQKFPSEFRSHRNVQKALNDITQKIWGGGGGNMLCRRLWFAASGQVIVGRNHFIPLGSGLWTGSTLSDGENYFNNEY